VQLDRGALLAPQRTLTQAVTGVVLRTDIISPVDGLFAESRHDNNVIAAFVGGPHAPHLTVVVWESLTPTQSSSFSRPTSFGLAP
jgi:hypothetical protein